MNERGRKKNMIEGGFPMIQRPCISPFQECGGGIGAEESDPKYKAKS